MRVLQPFGFNSIFFRIGGILFLSALGACGLQGTREDTSDIAEAFYVFQTSGGTSWPDDLFADEEVARKAEDFVSRREMEYGALRSYKKVASNKRVSVEAGRRLATATYVFEVSCENGRTREILTISKEGGTGSFRITEYIVEEIRMEQNSVPLGTGTA